MDEAVQAVWADDVPKLVADGYDRGWRQCRQAAADFAAKAGAPPELVAHLRKLPVEGAKG